MRYSTVPLHPRPAPLKARRGGSERQIHNPTRKDGTMSANTPDPSSHTHNAGVPPAPPEAHQKAGVPVRQRLLRRIAAYWLACDADADIRVMHRWRREDDDARAVRLETVIAGHTKRVTLYRLTTGAWSPIYQ
ncbi:hypothetical protein WL35_06920 [Burkholderia ubonensis]|nr:hypothetical protein WL35_06920 [Burkholderia ubonensis]